jgi:hypothetical protein
MDANTGSLSWPGEIFEELSIDHMYMAAESPYKRRNTKVILTVVCKLSHFNLSRIVYSETALHTVDARCDILSVIPPGSKISSDQGTALVCSRRLQAYMLQMNIKGKTGLAHSSQSHALVEQSNRHLRNSIKIVQKMYNSKQWSHAFDLAKLLLNCVIREHGNPLKPERLSAMELVFGIDPLQRFQAFDKDQFALTEVYSARHEIQRMIRDYHLKMTRELQAQDDKFKHVICANDVILLCKMSYDKNFNQYRPNLFKGIKVS